MVLRGQKGSDMQSFTSFWQGHLFPLRSRQEHAAHRFVASSHKRSPMSLYGPEYGPLHGPEYGANWVHDVGQCCFGVSR